jgi:hypothetical protein
MPLTLSDFYYQNTWRGLFCVHYVLVERGLFVLLILLCNFFLFLIVKSPAMENYLIYHPSVRPGVMIMSPSRSDMSTCGLLLQ